MPAPSVWAKRLAEDLVEVGSILGFDSKSEEPPAKGSELRIDVTWSINVDDSSGGGSPIPTRFMIVSIEIQYSYSPASITHGLGKAQYAGSPYHIVVSYNELPTDHKSMLRSIKPVGLKIVDGTQVNDLQLWIGYILSKPLTVKDKGQKTIEAISAAIEDKSMDVTEKIRETFEKEVELLFTPKELTRLFGTLSMSDPYNVQVLQQAIESTFTLVGTLLKKYSISSSVQIPANLLLKHPDSNVPADPNKDIFVINSNSSELYVASTNRFFAFKMEGREFRAHVGDFEVTETIPTQRVKSFIVSSIAIATEFLKQYDVSDEDKKELEQSISIMDGTVRRING